MYTSLCHSVLRVTKTNKYLDIKRQRHGVKFVENGDSNSSTTSSNTASSQPQSVPISSDDIKRRKGQPLSRPVEAVKRPRLEDDSKEVEQSKTKTQPPSTPFFNPLANLAVLTSHNKQKEHRKLLSEEKEKTKTVASQEVEASASEATVEEGATDIAAEVTAVKEQCLKEDLASESDASIENMAVDEAATIHSNDYETVSSSTGKRPFTSSTQPPARKKKKSVHWAPDDKLSTSIIVSRWVCKPLNLSHNTKVLCKHDNTLCTLFSSSYRSELHTTMSLTETLHNPSS